MRGSLEDKGEGAILVRSPFCNIEIIEPHHFIAEACGIIEASVNAPFRPDEGRTVAPHIDIAVAVGKQNRIVAHPVYYEGVRTVGLIDDMFFRPDPGAFERSEIDGKYGAEGGSAGRPRVDHLHLIRVAKTGGQCDQGLVVISVPRLDLVDMGEAG